MGVLTFLAVAFGFKGVTVGLILDKGQFFQIQFVKNDGKACPVCDIHPFADYGKIVVNGIMESDFHTFIVVRTFKIEGHFLSGNVPVLDQRPADLLPFHAFPELADLEIDYAERIRERAVAVDPFGFGIAEFEKVSYSQFRSAMRERLPDSFTDDMIKELYDGIELPERATSGSMGYDFKSPVDFTLPPDTVLEIPTGIKAQIDDGWGLFCLPRSGSGFKYAVRLANTVGCIDGDYYNNPKTEGHIIIKLRNGPFETLDIKAGDKFVQGIFIEYGITKSDDVSQERLGGFGSTDTE